MTVTATPLSLLVFLDQIDDSLVLCQLFRQPVLGISHSEVCIVEQEKLHKVDLIKTTGNVQRCLLVQERGHRVHIQLVALQEDVNNFKVFQLAGNMEWSELGVYCEKIWIHFRIEQKIGYQLLIHLHHS